MIKQRVSHRRRGFDGEICPRDRLALGVGVGCFRGLTSGVDGPCSRVLSWSPRVPVSSSHQGTCPHGWGSSLGHRLTWLTPVKALSPDSKMLGA